MENKLKIHYLYNSGFYVETSKHILIFDYFLNSPALKTNGLPNGVIAPSDLKASEKEILFFSSHSHGDHFNSMIFSLNSCSDNINYVLSNDIKPNNKDCKFTFVKPYDDVTLKDVRIRTFGSTDLGVSFLVRVDNINIFHAGDLNWWDWFDESDTYNLKMEQDFKDEIDLIKKFPVAVAFFPVDPRLKDKFHLGGEYFIEKLAPKYFIPMHFGEHYEITDAFLEKVANFETKVIPIHKRGEEIIISKR